MSELCSVPRVSERFAQSNALDEDIARLKYVSGKREEALRRLGIRTVGDLLLHIPHRYLDFTRSWSIEMAPIGTVCTIIATVDRIVQKQPRPRSSPTAAIEITRARLEEGAPFLPELRRQNPI